MEDFVQGRIFERLRFFGVRTREIKLIKTSTMCFISFLGKILLESQKLSFIPKAL